MSKRLKHLNIDKIILDAGKTDKTKGGRRLKGYILRARRILKILRRDGFKCVVCGSKNKLTIDHINGRSEFKHNNYNKYKLSVCQTLCVGCHVKKNRWVKI